LVRVLQAELLRQLGAHLLLVVLVQPRRRRGLGRRTFGLRGGPFLSLGRLLAFLLLLRLVLLFVLLFWLRLRLPRLPLAPGRRPGVSRSGRLRFLRVLVRHAHFA